MSRKSVAITYGTFDLFHVGHLNLLRRVRELGSTLIVGVSTDEFNEEKGKRTVVPYAHRADIVASLRFVDHVIPEMSWAQKMQDIQRYDVTTLAMGDDWTGKFDDLRAHCEVHYLPRTAEVSSSDIKRVLNVLDRSHVSELKQALDLISTIVQRFE